MNGYLRQHDMALDLQTTVTAISNIYTLNMDNLGVKRFKITTSDITAKTMTIINVPIECEMVIKIVFTNNTIITYPNSVIWKDGSIPTFTIGKTHFLYLITDDGGTNYQGTWNGAW